MSRLSMSAALRAPTRARLAVAAVAAGAVVAPAAPAVAQEGERYTVDVDWPATDNLPEGAEVDRRQVPVPPEIQTASAPDGWLAPKTVEEISITHAVQSGDSLGDLAAAYGFEGDAGWRVLFDANPEVAQPGHIWPGLELEIPADGDRIERRSLPKPPPPPEPEPAAEPEPATSSERSERSRASRSSSSSSSQSAASTVSGGRWDQLAACESGGNWSINTGNGYYGGLQFSLSSWRAVGGSGYPHEASKAEQIRRGEMLQARQGWGAWPACTRKLGWR